MWVASRLGSGREVGSNPSDYQKYNENMKFVRNLFFIIIHHYLLSLLSNIIICIFIVDIYKSKFNFYYNLF